MAISIEDLTARVERLEHLFQERAMERASDTDRLDRLSDRIWARVPFSAWLKISGPTFAVLALGFTALWNAQQATTQRILDLQESTTDRILELQQSTTDRILEMQQQILDLQRETRAGS